MNEQVIYCGPAIPRGGLGAFAVFIGPLPENVKKLIVQCHEIGRLIVPIDQLAVTRAALGKKGTEEHRLYEAVKKHKWEVAE